MSVKSSVFIGFCLMNALSCCAIDLELAGILELDSGEEVSGKKLGFGTLAWTSK